MLREVAVLFVGVFLSAERRIRRRAGTPDFVALADAVARVAQHERISRDRVIPHRAVQNGAAVAVEKIAAREQRTAAWRAAWGIHEGMLEQHALARDAIHVRRLH